MKINSSVAASSYLLDAVTNNIDYGTSVRSFSLHTVRSIIMRLMMVMIMVGGWNVVWGQCPSINFSEQGYTNGQEVPSATISTSPSISVSFSKGTNSNPPRYYTTGAAIRVYGGGYFTVTSTSNIISITLSFGSGDGSNNITANTGTYNNGSWTGNETSVKFTIGGTSGHRRIASIEVCVAPSYTITAQSNNASLGTVALSGTTITASPNDCVGYASPAYTVTSGTATVSQSGNTFNVTPSSNCTVRINFAAKPTYNVNWLVGGSSIRTRSYCQGSTIPAGDVPPDPTSSDCDGKTFIGWSATEVAETDDEPTLVTAAGATVNGEMNFYAVFAEASGSGHNEYCLYSGALTEGDYVIYYSGKAMNTTVSSDRLQYEEVTPISNTITTTDASIVWHIAQSGNYWTIYNAAAGKYAASTGVKNKAQMLDDGTDDKSLWSNSGTSTYEFVNKKNSASGINSNLRNNGTFGFACYASGTGGALSLYKRTISYSAYSTSCTPCEADATISSTALNFSDITSSSVTVEAPGGITSFGENCHIRSYGFVYGTSANPTLTSGTVAVAGTSYTTINSSFNKVIDGLSPCTTYHVRAYATNGHGTVYGSDCTFTTDSEAEITGLISVNGETSATLYWNLIGEPCVSGNYHYVVICRQGSSDIASSCSNYDFTSITANAAFGSGTQTSTGEYAVYSGSETSAAITNLTSGSTYTAAVFYVDDSGNCLLREQITFEYISITLLEPGDLAIVGVDYNIDNNIEGIYFSGDEISFVIFKSIKKGTTIEITDNGYERKFPGLWGTSEGILRFTWNGNSVLPEGSFITIMTRRDNIKSNNNLNDSIAIYVNNERSLNWQFSFEGNDFGFNDEDQIWIMQGGEWIEDLSVDVSGADGDHKHNMKYTGNVLYGFTATGWMSTYGYDLPKGSTLYPGCECFMTDITFNPGGRVKYKGTISGERSKYEWIGLMNDISNWEKFTSTENYHNSAVHNYTAISTPLRISHSVPTTNEWAGYKDNSWCNCANWYYLIVPDRNTDVTIPEITSPRNIVNIPANDIVECKNLTIEEGGSLSSNDSNAEMSVYGNLVVESGGQLSLANTNPMTLKLNGNLSNGGNFTTYRGLSMDLLSASAQNIGDVSSGDFALNNLTFRADGNTFDATTIKLFGNLNDLSPSSNGLGTQEIHFVGDVQQTINNNTAISNVTINNTSDDGVVVASGKMLNVSAEAIFVDGVVNGNVTFSASATSAGASIDSYVDGTVTKKANASAFSFPTGSNGVLGTLEVSSLDADTDLKFNHEPDGFDASEMPVWWNQNNMCGPNEGNAKFDHVTNMYFWNLGTSATIADAVFSVSADDDVHFNSETIEHDNADIDMAIYDGCWKNLGGTASTSDPYHLISVSDVDLPATRAGGDKVVTFGSIDHNTLLPIELAAFSAECNGGYAKISWTTATERNNDYFVLERSDDAISFSEIARLAGAGSSINQIDYTYIDNNVHGGDIFYRLVQVDYDGTRSVSEIIAVNCAIDADGDPEVAVYPNPFANDLTLHFENFGDRVALVEVYDMLGRMLVSRKVVCSQNDYEFVLPLGGLPDGAYNVRVSAEDVVINRQVVKNR